MMPGSQCPQCAAPLPPAAPKCQFCGCVTPWGATLSAHQEQAQKLAADRDKRARIAKAEASARTGMILALVGLPICCGPLSLVGGVLGYRGGSQAKAEGGARPVTSVIAMIAAVVSMVAMTTGIILYYRDQQKRDDRLTEIRARLKGKRDAATVDAKVACDIVEEHIVENGWGEHRFDLDKLHCDGALSVTDRRASLPDVRFNYAKDHFTVTACLEKRSRWFVLKMGDGLSCADLPPPAAFTPPPRSFSDDEIAADEKKARADLATAAAGTLVKTFAEKLVKVRAHAASAAPAEKVCSRADLARYVSGDQRRKVAAVDFDLLNGTKDSKGNPIAWGFMSHPAIATFLDEKRDVADRAKDIDSVRGDGGPLLAVYKASRKVWPKAEDGKNFLGGELEGWLFVYDIDSADRLCQTKLTFESSEEVDFRAGKFSSDKEKLQQALVSDLKENFQTSATDAIKRAAPDLRLGYKTLE